MFSEPKRFFIRSKNDLSFFQKRKSVADKFKRGPAPSLFQKIGDGLGEGKIFF